MFPPLPPVIMALLPVTEFWRPPAMEEAAPEALLSSPPEMVAPEPPGVFRLPPSTGHSGEDVALHAGNSRLVLSPRNLGLPKKQVGRTGRFVLTGSYNFLLIQAVSQTLAGRAAIHHLLPFSHDELLGRKGLATGGLSLEASLAKPKSDLCHTLFTGGYPRIHDKNLTPHRWLRTYYQAYLERDVRQVLNVGDLDSFRRFVLLCAGRAGQILNLSSLANDCGIAQPTARRWLGVLEASFVVRLLRPFHRNFGKHMIKAPKLHFVDSGLLRYLLRIRSAEELRFHASRGAVFESWVVSELTKRALSAGVEPDLWFWRDRRGRELDVILASEAGTWMIELKSGQTLGSDALKNIDFLRSLAGGAAMKAAVFFGGDRLEQRTKGHVLPWWGF